MNHRNRASKSHPGFGNGLKGPRARIVALEKYEEPDLEPQKGVIIYTILLVSFFLIIRFIITLLSFPFIQFCYYLYRNDIDVDYVAIVSSILWTKVIFFICLYKIFKARTIFSSLILDGKQNWIKLCFLPFIGGISLIGIFVLLSVFLPSANNIINNYYYFYDLKEIINCGGFNKWVAILFYVLLIPIFETYFFRRVMFEFFYRRGRGHIFVITSITTGLKLIPVFTGVLAFNFIYSYNIKILLTVFLIFIPNLISNLIYSKSNYNMMPSLILHILNNIIFILLIVFSVIWFIKNKGGNLWIQTIITHTLRNLWTL